MELIVKGDITGAKELESTWPVDSSHGEGSNSCDVSCSTENSDPCDDSPVSAKQQEWTSLQFSEAMSALNKFLKSKDEEFLKCANCQARNPKIRKPTFGCFEMVRPPPPPKKKKRPKPHH